MMQFLIIPWRMETLDVWVRLSFLAAFVILGRTIYRLYFHPLSKFPGPKLTASTHLYEFYYDVVKKGKFIWEIEKMHERYGPIVRINPRELHVKDPYFHAEIYASGGRKRTKDPKFIPLFSAPHSMITTIDHEHHRFRRGLVSNFFSKKAVGDLSPLIQGKVKTLMRRFEEAHHDGTVLDLTAAFCALLTDIIHEYTYGESLNYLHDKEFHNHVHGGLVELESVTHLNRFFPWLLPLMGHLPDSLLTYYKPDTAAIRREVIKRSQSVLRRDTAKERSDNKKLTLAEALCLPSIPAEERSLSRLEEEGMILLNGGTESPANALSVAGYHLATDKSILSKLRTELNPVMGQSSDLVPLSQLEQLPYLTGVVNEALRLSFGLVTRTPRIAPDENLKFGNYIIPAGTPLGTSSWFLHMDESIFPKPKSFNPERWIDADQRGENLTRFMVSFGKGSRACIGMNLAYAELYYTIAFMAHRFEFELYETTLADITVARDQALPFGEDGHWRVRARVSKVTQ